MTSRPAVTAAFRVDSGTRIGSGHVMRCVTLAAELRRRGARVVFICRDQAGHLMRRIDAAGFHVRALPEAPTVLATADDDYAAWLGVSQERDAEETLAALGGLTPDWIVADHYAIGARWQDCLRPHTGRMMAIDDLADREHRVDLLLDQNYVGDDTAVRYDGRVPDRCVQLLGPRYAMLQPEYAPIRTVLPPRGESVRRVLVFFGGSDPTNETAKALAALSAPPLVHLDVDVVLGSNHPDPDGIRASVAGRGAATLHQDVPTLAGLMARADLAIGAAGATLLERLCLQLPGVAVTLAANQERPARALGAAGYTRWIGSASSAGVDAYRAALTEPLVDLCRLAPLVDGLGARRVAEAMVPSESERLFLRRAVASDAGAFLDWRNDPAGLAMSFTQTAVSWSEHQAWFRRKIADPDCDLMVADCDGLPVGQCRLDYVAGEAVLSYSLDRIVRGRGWGRWLVSEAMRRAAQRQVTRLRAGVRPENTASCRIFARLGWDVSDQGDHRMYSWHHARVSARG